MFRSLKRVGTVVIVMSALMPVLAAAPAHATSVAECVESNTWTFTPELNLLGGPNGNADLAYNNSCEYLSATISPSPSESLVSGGGAGPVDFFYSGTCALASLSGVNYSGFFVGGVVAVLTSNAGQTFTEVNVGAYIPNTPCAESAAAGVAVGVATS